MKNLWAPWRMTYILGEDEAAKNSPAYFASRKMTFHPIKTD